MQLTFLILAIISLCIWVYLLLGRGFFWSVNLHQPAVIAESTARVVAIVPARNEGNVIGRCVESLLHQVGADVQIVVIDDASSDGTSEVARATAHKLGHSQRLTVLSGASLPDGWTGKLWAVQQGIEHASALHPDFLLLTDADVEHAPHTVATLISIAGGGSFDLTSYMVKLHCESLAEKLLIPAFVYFFFQLYPPAWISNPQRKTAGAAGGCMLVRPATLARAGGIASIRSEIIDDCALARVVKRSGGRVWLGLTDSSRSLRAYDTFGELGRMISRTAFNQLRHSTLLLTGTVIGLILTYVLPLALAWPALDGVARVGFAAALAVMTLTYLPMVRFYRLNPLWALTLPLAAIFYMGATIWSAVMYWSGRGGKWKGRAQDRSRGAAR